MRSSIDSALLLGLCVIAWSCSLSNRSGEDGGASAVDAGQPYTSVAFDAGQPDAGRLLDAGPTEPGASSDAGKDAGGHDAGLLDAGPADGGCGYEGLGRPIHVASGIDVCLPPVVCDPETCPPQLGDCADGGCVFHPGYLGIATFPEAWSTYYCNLSGGGCHGVTQDVYPEVTAQQIATARGLTLCDQAPDGGTSECVGIAAAPPMIVGNSEDALEPGTQTPVADWGLGLTEASGLCYELTGPGGTVLVALTDRCGGYCKCNGSGFEECGPCVNAPSLEVQCSCVGTVPGVYTQCCGDGCATLNAECDWCASNNHPHFDLDTGTFNRICGASAGQGSCQLTGVRYVPCLTASWPPGGSSGGTCPADSFDCNGAPAPHQEQVADGGSCCCNWNLCPTESGGCATAPASCGSGSCGCAAGQPDTSHPLVSSTGCCCLAGLMPQSNGSCE